MMALLASVLAATYVDAASYFHNDAFDGGVAALEAQFDALCGDTFCEGDYSNIVSLGLTCSVAEESATIGACRWAFAGSEPSVDPVTGAVTTRTKIFTCDLGVQGSADELLAFLQVAPLPPGDAFTAALLPGSGKTLYDTLVGCL